MPIIWGVRECEIHGDISGVGVELYDIADCLRATRWCSGVQCGAEEVHGLLAVWVPATVPLQEEQQKAVRTPDSQTPPGQPPHQAACSGKLLLRDRDTGH